MLALVSAGTLEALRLAGTHERRTSMSQMTTTKGAVKDSYTPALLTGQALVPSGLRQWRGDVGPDDVLLVDFDKREINKDGLYLIESLGADGVEWMGCRRFAVGLGGGLSADETGRGGWRDLESLEAEGLRVVGCVVKVYRGGLSFPRPYARARGGA